MMKNFFLKFKTIDLLFGLIIYLLLLFVFGWGTPDAFSSYSKNYNYGFPGPVVVKDVPTNFCSHPPCGERVVSYNLYNSYYYDGFVHISSSLVYSIIADLVTFLLTIAVVSYTRRKLLTK